MDPIVLLLLIALGLYAFYAVISIAIVKGKKAQKAKVVESKAQKTDVSKDIKVEQPKLEINTAKNKEEAKKEEKAALPVEKPVERPVVLAKPVMVSTKPVDFTTVMDSKPENEKPVEKNTDAREAKAEPLKVETIENKAQSEEDQKLNEKVNDLLKNDQVALEAHQDVGQTEEKPIDVIDNGDDEVEHQFTEREKQIKREVRRLEDRTKDDIDAKKMEIKGIEGIEDYGYESNLGIGNKQQTEMITEILGTSQSMKAAIFADLFKPKF